MFAKGARPTFLKNKIFVYETVNDESWIKNSQGASIVLYDEPYDSRLIEHAKKIKEKLRLDIIGIDYIINKPDNKIFFLEANCFPGLNVSDECVDYAKQFFLKRIYILIFFF